MLSRGDLWRLCGLAGDSLQKGEEDELVCYFEPQKTLNKYRGEVDGVCFPPCMHVRMCGTAVSDRQGGEVIRKR